MKLNEKLAQLRKEHGFSQSELSERMNVSRQTISRWELGDASPSKENMRRLCTLYQIPMSQLLDEEALSQEQPKPTGRVIPIWLGILLCLLATVVSFYWGSATSEKEESGNRVSISELPGEVVVPPQREGFDFLD